ncbi:MAG TPA: hypothetical protein VOA64_13190 [Candidatus Dormibacteraeota bacterium]|nr:hypothetical protein [Candidatus Dormibacteraeota bacterium]
MKNPYSTPLVCLLVCVAALQPLPLAAEQIAVAYAEGVVHGFLLLRTMDGNVIAVGDLTQSARGDRVTNHVVFHFKDGSLRDETVVFSQRGNFRVLKNHLIQKGPAFKRSMEVSADTSTGQVIVRYTEDDGKEKIITEHLDLPPDLANGIVFMLLKNIPAGVARTTVSMLVATPKPRLVKLVITPAGEDPFLVGNVRHKAMHYVVKVEIGGAAGVVAPLVGKQPPDTHVWVLREGSPAFLKSEGPLDESGPIWRIELTTPTFPQNPSAKSPNPPKPSNH